MIERPSATTPAKVRRFADGSVRSRSDVVATEEPLEIRVQAAGEERTVAITMRTPGNDFELAVGYLYAEGVIDGPVGSVRYCTSGEQLFNTVTVDLDGPMPDLGTIERHGTMTSACGVCGKASIDAVRELGGPPLDGDISVSTDVLRSLPDRLRDAQRVFDRTGGLHGTGLFTPGGELVAVREDVGRHNAMDKVVGSALMNDVLPLTDVVAVVSGRASYELVQKARRAGIAILCAVGAPSSLAVDVAGAEGMTLVGFLSEHGFNVYTEPDRISR